MGVFGLCPPMCGMAPPFRPPQKTSAATPPVRANIRIRCPMSLACDILLAKPHAATAVPNFVIQTNDMRSRSNAGKI